MSDKRQPTFSAARIAELLADSPDRAVRPTPEQTEVIEQPLGRSVLVIAGAGSGKTETMANRVVWLVANGLVEPSQVLGLTFTRKAAGELSERVLDRLRRFSERLERPAPGAELSEAEQAAARVLSERMSEGLDLPEVSTYNSFASGIVQEFGALAGVAAAGTVIDESTAWGIAREVVVRSEDPELSTSRDSIGVLVRQLLTIDHAVAENLTSFDDAMAAVERLEFIGELPYNDKKREGRYAAIEAVLTNLRATRLAIRLAAEFAAEKRRRGLIEFSDQLATAVETARRSPEAIRVLHQRTPVVLLDEVQDTSVAQTSLLSLLFRGSSVMAVGDPHQSIYGFRGASASNLQSFHRDFGITGGGSGVTLSLSTSWRNPTAVLAAANAVSAPLSHKLESEANGLSVKPLISRTQYLGSSDSETGEPPLHVQYRETITEEFETLAEWMRDARNAHLARTGEQATAAVLFRNRTHMAAVADALWSVGVPNRIVGLGGLLTTPEVTDLVCGLRCLWYADAASDLVRLLAGPRFSIGVADLAGLRDAARWFSERDHAQQPIETEHLDRLSGPGSERTFTLLDALDEIASMSRLDHRALRNITPVGRERMREAGQMLRSLRQEVGSDIGTLVRSVTHALRLDIELDAAEHTGYHGGAAARANLEAFGDLLEAYLATDEAGTLASVLAWLERARDDDAAAQHLPEPEPGTVQLITVHGSKGLEWDLVAVPRMVVDEFPAAPRDGMGWLRAGQLPDELRGDAAARPALTLDLVETQKDVTTAIDRYKDALKDRHADEERRLAYVAITRAASRLLITGSFWGGQTRPRKPAPYLRELQQAGLIEPLPESSASSEPPNSSVGRTLEWPLDPLGRRATSVRAAADALRAELAKPESGVTVHPVVALLLAERETEREQPVATSGPIERVTASTFHDFIDDPVQAERRRLRPLPVRPYRRTRTGNLFHEWVERRANTPIGTQLPLQGIEFDLDEHDEAASALEPAQEPSDEALEPLIENFERSRWAQQQPVAVELEITLPFAGRTLVCKLDAVYRHELADGSTRYEIVDWKSGRPPATPAERASRFLQLDLYRHAYARWAGIDADEIDVTLFYVAEGEELRGEHSRSFEELEQLWLEAASSVSPVI